MIKTDTLGAATLGIPAVDLAVLNPQLHRQPYLDATLYYAKRNTRLFFRCMDKVTDERLPSHAKKLSLERTRSRIELTFIDQVALDRSGPASVDLNSIGDIVKRGLSGFNLFLQFGLPIFTPSKDNPALPNKDGWEVFSKSGVAGLTYMQDVVRKVEAARSGKMLLDRTELMSTGQSRRHSAMNRRVPKAFERLQKKWERGWGRDD